MLVLSSARLGASYMVEKFKNVLGNDLKDKSMLVIACASKDEEGATQQAIKDAVGIGFSEDNIFSFNPDNANDFVNEKYDFIYALGGNTFKLFDTLRKCGFYDVLSDKVLNDGTTFIGFSAGAYLMSLDIAHIAKYDENNVGVTDFSGLGLAGSRIICHFDNSRYGDYFLLTQQTEDHVLAIYDEDVVVVRDRIKEYL